MKINQIMTDRTPEALYFNTALEHYSGNLPQGHKLNLKGLIKFKSKDKALEKELKNEKHIKTNINLWIVSANKSSLDWLKRTLSEFDSSVINWVVVLDVHQDSMINSKYIKNYMQFQENKVFVNQWMMIPFNEIDRITRLEDAFEEVVSYKYLSRRYMSVIELLETYKSCESLRQGGGDHADCILVS